MELTKDQSHFFPNWSFKWCLLYRRRDSSRYLICLQLHPSLVSIACSQTHRLSRLGWGRSGDSVLDHPGHLRKGDGTPWPSLLRENFPSEVPRLRGSKVKFKMLEKMEGPPVPRVAASPPPQRTGKRRPLEAEQRGLRAAFWGNSIKEIIFPQTKPRIA